MNRKVEREAINRIMGKRKLKIGGERRIILIIEKGHTMAKEAASVMIHYWTVRHPHGQILIQKGRSSNIIQYRLHRQTPKMKYQ